ncbi:adrenodoxin, mitochondrial isoform X2 [Panthera uncia]|uniref:adrenodoxin, mitochondrial isoform X2 n=1 Tax=Panthera uncia TaxID=29064 RepID=UPI0020FFD43A|nr:adrenodoxin, mitochondrial isoform X2 [Panthera uncia]
MAAAGGARLLRAASVALGGAAYRWLLHARPRAGAGCLAGLGGPGGPGGPGRGGGALAPRTLSVSAPARSSSEDKITVHFVNRDGETLTAKGKVGDSLLDVVVENNLDIDGFESARASQGRTEREGDTESKAGSRLRVVSTEPNMCLEPADHEIKTGAKVGRSTECTTQVHVKEPWPALRVTSSLKTTYLRS